MTIPETYIGHKEFLEMGIQEKITKDEIQIVKNIVAKMSYSTVKKNGFPKFNDYQSAYHIVREADLLSAYSFDRAMIFSMISAVCTFTKGKSLEYRS